MNITTLNETKVSPTALAPQPIKQSTVLRLFADHGWAARLWCSVAIGSVLIALSEPYFLISALRTKQQVVILDEAGTYHLSPLLDFEDATKLQTSQTLLACLALLEKNPDGFDYPELLQKLYLPDAFAQAQTLQSSQADELHSKQIHQKVEVTRIDVLQTRNDQVLVEATGQLIRIGLFHDEPFTESSKFRAQFIFLRNPNLTSNGRFPLAVWQFTLNQS